MNSVDYSKALARERENFQNTIKQDRENNARRLQEESERHERIQSKQAETHATNRQKLEEDYKTNIDNVKDKSQETIYQQKQDFVRKNQSELDRFARQRDQDRREFDQKFSNTMDGFRRSSEKEKQFFDNYNAQRDMQTKSSIQKMARERDEQLKEVQDKFLGSGSSQIQQLNLDKRQQAQAHEDKMSEVLLGEAERRDRLSKKFEHDLLAIKKAQASEREHIDEYNKNKVDKTRSVLENRMSDLNNQYAEKNEQLLKKAKDERLATDEMHKGEVRGLKTQFERDIRKNELNRKRSENGQAKYDQIIQDQHGLKDEKIFKDKLQQVKNDLEFAKKDYAQRTIKDRENYQDTLKEEAAYSTGRLESKEKELNANKLVELARLKEKASHEIGSRTAAQREEKLRHDDQLVQDRKANQAKIKSLKEAFNRSLEDMQEKNEQYITDLKTQTKDDKAEFIQRSNQQRNEEIIDLRKSFSRLMDTTVTGYETRMRQLEKENEKLRQELDFKVSQVMSNADKESRILNEIYKEKRVADKRAAQNLMDTRDAHFKNKITEISDSFQRKMDQERQAMETQNRSMINDYESKLKEKEIEKTKAIGEKQARHSAELQALKIAQEQEKATLISRYESQLSQMRLAQKEQAEKLNDYKRMS
jgi:hypothetical protein